MDARRLRIIGSLAVLITCLHAAQTVGGQEPAAGAKVSAGTSEFLTPWGAPDLQGVWNDELTVPLQRATADGEKEFRTDKEIAELDQQRGAMKRRDDRGPPGSEEDTGGAFNAYWQVVLATGRRTSLIVDPSDGRIPPVTPAVQERRDEIRGFRLALLQATPACKEQAPRCAGGTYGPPSPKRNERMPYYHMDRGFLNRHDHIEEQTMSWRCLTATLPDFTRGVGSAFRRIVQSPRSIAITYEIGQGQGFERIIPLDGGPHLSPAIRQWWGDSRGRWEGQSLVVDVTNFSDKTDFQGSRENLHLVERFTRTGANTLEYVVTMDDPLTWTRPWTVKEELTKQADEANRFYPEPRCHEGKIVESNDLTSARADEKRFAEGKGPDPATMDSVTAGNNSAENQEPIRRGG